MTETLESSKAQERSQANTVWLSSEIGPNDLARYAIGLANTKGGTLVIGASANGGGALHPLQLTHALFEMTTGRLTVHCAQEEMQGANVLVVSVPRSPYVLATAQGEVIGWDGSRLVPLEAQDQDPAPSPDFTAQVPPTTSLSDLDPLEVHRLRGALELRRGADLAELPDLDLLRALGLLENDKPNIAAILLAGTPKALRRYVPQAEMDYYFHASTDLEFEFRETMLRPLPAMLERLRELIQARNKYRSLHVGLFQLEVWDFDEVVYREAILNALTHRDYTSRDTVQIHHYPNRLEIANPGGFQGGVTTANILRHQPKRRNPVLADALARLGYIERAGLGVDRMYRLLLRHGKEPPEYTAYPDSVNLEVRNPEFDEAFVRFVARKQEEMGSLGLDLLIVLSCLKREGSAGRERLGVALQLAADRVGRTVRPFEEAGLIERLETRQGDVWALSGETRALFGFAKINPGGQGGRRVQREPFEDFETLVSSGPVVHAPMPLRAAAQASTPLRFRLSKQEQRELVLEMIAAQGSIANRDVRQTLHLSLSQASHLLRQMAHDGVLERLGNSPRTRRYGQVAPVS